MTLHEAIQTVLNNYNRPMHAKDIANEVNKNEYYYRNDGEPLSSNQIYARVKNYPSLFHNINGYIILVNDVTWKNLLTNYEYLTHTLKGIFIQADIQFIIAILLYYKRLVDINNRLGHNYPLAFDENIKFSLNNSLNEEKSSFIGGLKSLENYILAPEGVFEECSRLLAKLDNYKLHEIRSIIKNIQTAHLSDAEFGNIFEYFITVISISDNKASLNNTPFSLRQLMVEVLDPKDGTSIYDPVAGIGSLLIESLNNRDVDIYGSEINKRIAQLGNMNIMMHGLKNASISAEDCFEQLNFNKQYDYIIGDLPANGITNSFEYYMLYNQYNILAPKSGKSFGSLVLLALSKLNKNGKAVLTVSDGFLIKKGKEQEIREFLISNDVVETVISLPFGTLRPYTDAKASLLVLNKNKPSYLRGRIQFIEGKAVDQTVKSLILNNDDIIQTYKRKEDFDKNAQVVNIDDLRPDANLAAEAYDAQFLLGNSMLKEGKARLLIDLVEIRSGVSPEKSTLNKDNAIPLVKVEKLSKDILDVNLNVQKSEGIDNHSRYERNVIYQECILVARIGDNLKATIFKPTTDLPAILPHNNIYVLIPNNSEEINIEYLYYQLHSTFIQEQIERRKLGAVMPYISISGLKDTIIPYMSLQAQNEFVQSQKANLIAEERSRVEDRIKALGYKEETKQAEADVIKTLTHQLRPTFSGLNGITKRIERIAQREKIGELKEYDNIELNIDPELEGQITIPDNYNLTQLLDKLSKETNHLSDILTNVDKVMNFKLLQEDLKEVNLYEFLIEYKSQKEVEQNDRYSIDIKGEAVLVLLHKPSFKELLDQLLNNAEKHAFVERDISNKVQFNIRYNRKREVIIIEYSNNGKPYELSQNDFTTAFEKGNKSKGSGIGGNYISRIVSAHNGKLIIEENYKKGFALTIELPTPKNKIYE